MLKRNIFISVVSCALAFFVILLSAWSYPTEQPSVQTGISSQGGSDKPFCVLVLGKDRASGLCDVIMLVSIDRSKDSICVMQIPRDTYALYGNGDHRKLNAAVKLLGGEEAFCTFLRESLEVGIDGYVSLELDSFRKIVDSIGGVEIELTKNFYYEDPEQDLYIYLQKGKQTLDGEKAEMLVRYRSGYARGDLDRLDVQKLFMASLFEKFRSKVNLLNAYSVASEILPYLESNVGAVMLTSVGLAALKIDMANMAFLTLPGEDAISEKSGASFYVMSVDPTNKVLKKYFGKRTEEIDKNKSFLHSSYKNFCDIYYREEEASLTFADTIG